VVLERNRLRPLLFSLPAVVVGLIATPLVVRFILDFDIPKKWRLPASLAGLAVVAGLTIAYWSESVPVHAYGMMLAVGLVVGISVGVSRARFAGFTETEVVDLGMYVALWGVIGARLFHAIERHDLYFTGPKAPEGLFAQLWAALSVWRGGLVFYGGLIGAMCYVAYWALRRKDAGRSLVALFDMAAPCVLLGLSFGRVGCFLNGCCYGGHSEAPWSVAYPRGGILWDAVHTAGSRSAKWLDLLNIGGHRLSHTFHVHPAPLYAALLALAAGAVQSWVFYKRPRPGTVSVVFLLTYPPVRFVLEGWARGDCPPAFPGISSTLTISQYVSLVGVAAGLIWGGLLLRGYLEERKAGRAADGPARS
jgi:phosphatidylglycerol:prolipoprotein diacylglycerol transferase